MASSNQLTKSAWMLASIAVVVATLYLAKGVLAPLMLSVLLSFLLSPVCDWLERHKLGRIPAVAVTACIGFAILGAAIWTAAAQVSELAPKIPEYQDNLEAKLRSTNASVSAALDRMDQIVLGFDWNLSHLEDAEVPLGTNERPYAVRILSSPTSPLQVLGGNFGTLLEILGSTGIVIVLVVFFSGAT
jgi:predicted PurR-regulated permease PerM